MTTRRPNHATTLASSCCLRAACVVGLLAATTGTAQAGVIGPYTPNANTLHLWHFDETDGNDTITVVPTFADTGNGTARNLDNNRGIDGTAAFSGFGTSFDVEAGGVSGSQTFNSGRAADYAGAGPQSEWEGAGGAFTYEALIRTSSSTQGQQILSRDGGGSGDPGGSARGWIVSLNSDAIGFFNGSGTSVTASLPATGRHVFAADEWFHVAVTFDGTDEFNFYWTRLDNAGPVANLIGTTITAIDVVADPQNGFAAGAYSRGSWRNQLLGAIDEVRISNIALSADQFMFAVPEPSTGSMLGLAMFGLVARRRRRK